MLSEKRIGEMRAILSENFKRMRKAYDIAVQPNSDSEARAAANDAMGKMWQCVENAKREYNGSDVMTTSVEYAANELLSELRVYEDALKDVFTMIPRTGVIPQASPIPKDPEAPGTVGRLLPSSPMEGRRGETGAERVIEDPNRTRRNLDLSERTQSKASSITRGVVSRKGSSHSSRLSEKATQARRQRDEDLAREEERREEDKSNNELTIEDLRRQIEEIKRKESLDVKLHTAKKASIQRTYDEQEELLRREEEEEGENPELEFTVEGLNLGGGAPGDRTQAWAAQTKGSDTRDLATSTSRKDRMNPTATKGAAETFIIGEDDTSVRSGKDSGRRRKVKTQVGGGKQSPPQPARKQKQEEKGVAQEVKEELSRGAQMLVKEVEELEEKLRVKREKMLEQLREEKEALKGKERDAMEEVVESVRTKEDVGKEVKESEFGKFMEIQARMAAITTLQAIRPKTKFANGRRTDFAKQMKQLESAFETPAVTARMKLQELPFYFEGSALRLIESDVIRRDAGRALEEAMKKLQRKFGVRRETALEMLEELLAGKPVGEKDHNALLDFYARLLSIYSLAQETGRAEDFEARSVVETILKKKVPHLMVKWFKKSVRQMRARSMELGFEDFLKFLDEEHAVAELMARAMGSQQGGQKAVVGAKVAATNIQEGPRAVLGNPSALKCCACGSSHALTGCASFRDMGAIEKRKLCQVAGICYKCLGAGHAARFCKEEGKCATCNGPHHASVHNLFAPQARATGGGSTGSGEA